VKHILIFTKGLSTGFIPNHVSMKKIIVNHQKVCVLYDIFEKWNFIVFKFLVNMMRIDITSIITPPSLFGIARKIAYANRKYHSGWMCVGVTIGFAGVKLSGSIKR